MRPSTDVSQSATDCPGSHIIKSNDTLSKPARPSHGEGLAGPGRGMQPAQTLQLLVPERLDTKAQTIDAGLPEAGERVIGDGFRIGLEGDLGVRGSPRMRGGRSR